MAEQEVQELLLKISTDRAEISKTQRDIAAFKSSLYDAKNATGELDKANIDKLKKQITESTEKLRRLREEARATQEAIKDIPADIPIPTAAPTSSFSGKRSAEGIGNLASLLGSVGGGSASAPIRAAAEISRVTEVLPQLAEQFAALGPLGIAAAAGVAVATAAVALLDHQSQGLRDTVLGLIAGQKEYFELINKGSREDLENAIKTKQDALTVAKSQRDELVKLQSDAFKDAQGQFGDFGARLAEQSARSFNIAGINDQDKAIDDLNKEIAANEVALGRLTGAQQANITATNDLTKAHEAQVSVFIKSAKDAADEQAKLAGLQRTASSSQVENLIAANKERVDALTAEANTLKSVSATSQESRDRLFAIQTEVNNLTGETTKLEGAILDAAKARETEKKAIDDQKKASDELTKLRDEADNDEQKRADDVKAIAEKTEAAQSKLASAYRLANDEAKKAAQQEDAKTKREREDADLETAIQREAKKAEIDQDAAAQEVERRQKLADTLKKIGEEFAFDEAGAVQDRDAVALAAAIDKRNKATSEAQTTAQKEKEQIAKDRQNRIEGLQKEFAAQDAETKRHRASEDRETRIARDNDTRARREKFNRDQADLQTASRAEILARQQTYTKQIGDLAAFLKTQETNNAGYFGTILTKAKDFQKQLEDILNGSSSSSTSGTSGSNNVPYPGHPVPTQDFGAAYALGGTTARGLGGGFTFAPQITGQTRAAIKAQVNAHLDQLLDEMGA